MPTGFLKALRKPPGENRIDLISSRTSQTCLTKERLFWLPCLLISQETSGPMTHTRGNTTVVQAPDCTDKKTRPREGKDWPKVTQ